MRFFNEIKSSLSNFSSKATIVGGLVGAVFFLSQAMACSTNADCAEGTCCVPSGKTTRGCGDCDSDGDGSSDTAGFVMAGIGVAACLAILACLAKNRWGDDCSNWDLSNCFKFGSEEAAQTPNP